WTGDIAVFAPTASFLFDVEDFLASWCRDLALEQAAAGVPFVVPDPLKYGELPEGIVGTPVTAIWSDAAIWVPWALWQASGSTAIIEAQFESMTRHLDSVRARLGDNGCWADDGFQFGDWLDPAAPPDRPGEARADNFVVATACAYRSATMFADLAAATERADIAAEARALAERIRAGFRAGYLEPDGRIRSDAPTVYAIAIAFGILTEDEAARSGDRLAALVAENGYRISTGFAGTPYISEALSSSGHHDVAVRLLLERECPSWLYPVTMGATTMWERWDSMLPDGTVNPGEMTSFNHYALGSVADWLHRSVAGLAPAAPGYAAIRFAPGPAEGIDDAAAELETPHGRAAIAWRRDGQSLAVDLVVPDGVPAVLVGPNGVETPVEPGTSTHVLAL
ncbi:MAG TPA: alpha-L-rhamnosidase C-terminal domain-containing protein, partial [Pseudolysinimonas sp.]|nr:alpha-L-rhamnosidase C-terminal domain-containing protein [Pseudolysinimonas sp.]